MGWALVSAEWVYVLDMDELVWFWYLRIDDECQCIISFPESVSSLPVDCEVNTTHNAYELIDPTPKPEHLNT